MKTPRFLEAMLGSALLVSATAVHAQQQFKFTFQGLCRTTNDAGRFVTHVLTERDILRRCALDHGLGRTNYRQLQIVYQKQADVNGDLVQVINTNGTVLCTPFRILFQRSITNADTTHAEKLAFVFDPVQSDAVGSANLTEHAYLNPDGSLRRYVITGRMQFFDQVYHSNRFAVCTGTFSARTGLNPP